MRTKNNSITLEKLNPAFIKPLQLFDLLHKEMTGEQIVITSANDGEHMPSSKHYTNDAIDVRIWHYDKLARINQIFFADRASLIFPNDKFDVVLEEDHFHIEYDPKPIKDIPEPRIKPLPDYEIPPVPENVKLTDRQIVVSTLDRFWFELDGRSVIFGTVNFITKRLTGYGFFKDKLNLNKDQSFLGRLLELINELIKKLRRTKS